MEIFSWIWAIAKTFMFWTFMFLYFITSTWLEVIAILFVAGLLLWGFVAFVNTQIDKDFV